MSIEKFEFNNTMFSIVLTDMAIIPYKNESFFQ
ncbi:hypothetical protein EZS27_025418 [termite gut metagenome]|uniref:Uncharacterized protein n=1 Tax=termite gut metagenome TaxID=433724 RepID=A0A5J4QVR9_9ZZZZ